MGNKKLNANTTSPKQINTIPAKNGPLKKDASLLGDWLGELLTLLVLTVEFVDGGVPSIGLGCADDLTIVWAQSGQ